MNKNIFSNDLGFTMVEMLIVIVILGITSALGVINLTRSTATYIEETAREKLIQQLRFAKTEAIARNTTIKLVSAVAPNAYQITAEDGSELDGITSRPFKIDDRQEVTVSFNNLTGNEVVFDNRGRITNISAGTNASITIARAGGSTRTIILYSTGFLEE